MIANQTKFSTVLVSILALVGIVFPTSSSGVIADSFYLLAFSFLFLVLLLLNKSLNRINLLVFVLINASLWLYTAFASTYVFEFSFGIYVNFFLLSFLYFIDLSTIKLLTGLRIVLNVITAFLLILGFGVVLENAVIKLFISNYYSASYDNLILNMLARGKPIGTFATHSVGAFFTFLFFYLNLLTFKVFSKKLNLVFGICLLVLLFFIKSNTSLLFLLLSIYLILREGIGTKRRKAVTIFVVGIAILLFITFDLTRFLEIFNVVDNEKNGLLARYSGESPLELTFRYLYSNPFSSIGLTKPDDLYFSDSGFVLYFLRGSFFLLFGVYYGFYYFLKRNLSSHKMLLFLFFVTMVFEIGYPILIHARFLYFIPFLIVYLNFLKQNQDVKS